MNLSSSSCQAAAGRTTKASKRWRRSLTSSANGSAGWLALDGWRRCDPDGAGKQLVDPGPDDDKAMTRGPMAWATTSLADVDGPTAERAEPAALAWLAVPAGADGRWPGHGYGNINDLSNLGQKDLTTAQTGLTSAGDPA